MNFNTKAIQKLQRLSKLTSQGPRNYQSVIGMEKKLACYTDGFHLLAVNDESFTVEKKSFKNDLTESQVNYPNFTAVMPSHGKELDHIKLDGIFRGLANAPIKTLADLWIEIDEDITVFYDKRTTTTKKTNGCIINPSIFMKTFKSIKKDVYPIKAYQEKKDSPIAIEYSEGFTLIIVPIVKG